MLHTLDYLCSTQYVHCNCDNVTATIYYLFICSIILSNLHNNINKHATVPAYAHALSTNDDNQTKVTFKLILFTKQSTTLKNLYTFSRDKQR